MTPPPPGQQKSPTAPTRRELVLVAIFPYPWSKTSLKEEIDALDSGAWNPSDEDMWAVAQKDAKSVDIKAINNIGNFLAEVQSAKNGSLERVVVITHSNDSVIAFSGIMNYGGTKGQVGLGQANPASFIDSEGLDQSVVNWLNTDPRGRAQRDAARVKFTSDGEVVFVSCHGGGSGYAPPLFLADFAGAFKVTVKAFRDAIWYHPDYDSPNGTPAKPYKMNDRSITSVGSSGTQAKGFRHLLTSSSLKTIKSPFPIP
jgi:hypothetical protein